MTNHQHAERIFDIAYRASKDFLYEFIDKQIDENINKYRSDYTKKYINELHNYSRESLHKCIDQLMKEQFMNLYNSKSEIPDLIQNYTIMASEAMFKMNRKYTNSEIINISLDKIFTQLVYGELPANYFSTFLDIVKSLSNH